CDVISVSFNPLPAAIIALAESAERADSGRVVFALSTLTVDKEQSQGALLADRLLVLELHARHVARRAIALLNRGLYVDQAKILRTTLPELRDITFLVGFDKIVQVFNRRYYVDGDAALRELFGLASFAVAPRAGAGLSQLRELLARPENRGFADRVRPLKVDPELAGVSSSAIRGALQVGD